MNRLTKNCITSAAGHKNSNFPILLATDFECRMRVVKSLMHISCLLPNLMIHTTSLFG